MRVAPSLELSAEEVHQLTRLARSNTASVRAARRAQIVLLAAHGNDNHEIAEALDVGRVQVGRWRTRYANGGLEAMADRNQRKSSGASRHTRNDGDGHRLTQELSKDRSIRGTHGFAQPDLLYTFSH